ncbi:MAG: hypothetical protein NZ523_13555 [Elioraea sp.]|nr:hypothetical protein [Elioraea sp.]
MSGRRLAVAAPWLLAASFAAAQPNPDFWVANRSAMRIDRLYVSPVDRNDWGGDWLGEHVLRPGERFPVRPPRDGRCLYDIRVVYADGSAEERRRVNVCAVAEVSFSRGPAQAERSAAAGERTVTVVNRSARTMMQLFVSPSTERSWGEDRLGESVLPGGRSVVVRLPREGGCEIDLRAVFDDNSVLERRRIDSCRAREIALP